jgi:phosphocarrier protein FPr/phosphocarrier protein
VSDLILLSPLDGWAASLDEAPDPVFADRMLGDGVAIDPTGDKLFAPCAGQVIGVQRTLHAVTLRAVNGAEILMHLGLETVGLGGEGFTAHVKDGQTVAAGDLLISLDLDFVARRAKSLISPIVITNGDDYVIADMVTDRLVKVGEPLMTLRGAGAAAEARTASSADAVTRSIVVPLLHGVHARPAAAIAAVAKIFASDVSIIAGDRSANAKSPVALMTLGVRRDDPVTLSATGADAATAVEALATLILGGIDELAPAPAAKAEPAPPAPAAPAEPPSWLKGVMAAPGLAIGPAFHLRPPEIEVDSVGRGVSAETQALAGAITAVKARIEAQAETSARQQRAILGAHLAFLDDPELAHAAHVQIGDGASAGAAWRGAVEGYVQMLRGLSDPRLAERVDDLIDLERQVLLVLTGALDAPPDIPAGAIVLADDLLPSQLMGLDASRIAGLCTARGGPTSHVAILAAAMNVPLVVAAGARVAAIPDGAQLILDADAGRLDVSPDASGVQAARSALEARTARRALARAGAHEDCRTADGVRIEVLANLASQTDADAAVAAGAEGCGLLRTEFLFMERDQPPGEDEQLACYQAIADALGVRPLTIRTLDVGGDKPVGYLAIPPEDNPALGLRGVRTSLWRPDILKTQLRALLRVSDAAHLKIMVPMIASVAELLAVKAIIAEVRAELGVTQPIPVGVMVETPAAAVTCDLICIEAEFVSLGTNDLAQYTLAMDRANPLLAAEVDGLHPAVLRLIGQSAEGARANGRPVSVCGGLASDLTAAPILIGLGVTSLSASPAIIPELKALVRTLTIDGCKALAAVALAQTSAGAVRAPAPPDRSPLLGRGAA